VRRSFALLGLLALAAPVQAQDGRVTYRASVGYASMVSTDQLGRLELDRGGMSGDLRVGYLFVPWFELGVATVGGAFFSERDTGGLIAPVVSMLVKNGHWDLRPYLHADGGVGVTGKLVRPFFRVGLGVELPISNELAAGPLVGYGVVVHSDREGDSTDAEFLFVSAGISFTPGASPPSRKPVQVAPPPPPPRAPREPENSEPVNSEPDQMLIELLDRAVPTDPTRVELLAAVLFALDSDELEPIGVAMLHEVVNVLEHRKDIRKLAIQGYADTRGSPEHNKQLSTARAERVRVWLVEHGIAEERLVVVGAGESEPLEKDGTEPAHQQNRRVVFRVLELGDP
jgi:outer membrane protein OmpA-like peptidoglycan-associated protein